MIEHFTGSESFAIGKKCEGKAMSIWERDDRDNYDAIFDLNCDGEIDQYEEDYRSDYNMRMTEDLDKPSDEDEEDDEFDLLDQEMMDEDD
ncbi:MAG: hypothetical protein J6U50_02975 [Lachnospiraceae bacterium]|nr:hypothetical protein [Lachnospiraceae bacterium]